MPFLPMPVEGYGRPQCASATWEQKHSPAWCPGTHQDPRQFEVDITIFRLFTFLKHLHWNATPKQKKLYSILNLVRCSQDDQILSMFRAFMFVIHSMYLRHGKSQHINGPPPSNSEQAPFLLDPPTHPLNPSRPQSLRTPSTAVSLKPKKRDRAKENCIESAKKNIHKTRGFIEWPNNHFRFHRSLVCGW